METQKDYFVTKNEHLRTRVSRIIGVVAIAAFLLFGGTAWEAFPKLSKRH